MSCLLACPILLGLVAPKCSNAFMMEYTDCVTPENIRVDVARVCVNGLGPPSSNKRMVLVQTKTVTRLQGYKCKIRESRFRYYSGAFLHLRVAKVPTISHDLLVSTEWCRVLRTQRHFQPPGSTQVFDIKIDKTTFVQVAAVGELKVADDTVGCKGETMHKGNGMLIIY